VNDDNAKISACLSDVSRLFETAAKKRGKEVKNIVVIMSDGWFHDWPEATVAAKALKKSGVTILTLCSYKMALRCNDLAKLASDTGCSRLIENHGDLVDVVEEIAMCP
jgi:hypothetical protein